MRHLLCFAGLWALGLTGCQSWGGGYSPQSITRVPAISTGSFQVPGNYYGNQGSGQVSGGTSSMGYPAGSLASHGNTQLSSGLANSPANPVAPAQFTTEMSEQSLNVPVITAGGSAPVNNW